MSGSALVVLLCEGARASALVESARAQLRAAGFAVEAPELEPATFASDRAALAELERVMTALERRPDVARERIAVLGFARGGTLAFLLGCARRLAAVVDVEGPVLHPELSSARPIQPLELALNLEGAFLGVFGARSGAVTDAERALLAERLSAAARPFELVVLSEAGRGFFDPRQAGYDAARSAELWRRVLAFLEVALAPDPDSDSE